MLTHCPHCRQTLPFTTEHQTRIKQALNALEAGKTLAIKCPLCQKAITMEKPGATPRAAAAGPGVEPPPPPNLDWLRSGSYVAEGQIEDVPMALLLHKPGQQCDTITESLENFGYQCVQVETAEDAIERLRFATFACVAFQTGLDGPLGQSPFHNYMRRLPMETRRYLFYILIGEQLHTLYNLEALANSANLTINPNDLPQMDLVLRKAIPSYEELFGPFLEELSAYGKR